MLEKWKDHSINPDCGDYIKGPALMKIKDAAYIFLRRSLLKVLQWKSVVKWFGYLLQPENVAGEIFHRVLKKN